MLDLELFLDKQNTIDISIYNKNELFGYENEDLYILHLDFMLNNLYNIKMVENKRKRLNQKEFREQLIEKYNCCIITGETCVDELTAAHIVPIINDENYDIDNGLLMMENLHKTFDKYKWSINPGTMKIEIKDNMNVGSIKKYKDHIIDIEMNEFLRENLKKHYERFKKID